MGVTIVLGAQWGDEGKGKLVDILAQEADIVARCQVSFYLYYLFLKFLFSFHFNCIVNIMLY